VRFLCALASISKSKRIRTKKASPVGLAFFVIETGGNIHSIRQLNLQFRDRIVGQTREIALALKIIGAGFGRTGTHSLKTAIEILGLGPCHHMYEVRRSSEQITWWTAAARGEAPDWDQVFAGYDSQIDWPGSRYWKELCVYYPDAKVILTVRDPEDWYASIRKTILPASVLGRTEDPDPAGRAGSDIIYKIALEGIFNGRLGDKEYALDVYAKHQRNVIETIPAERLLVYDVKQGWDPLCAFLNVARPETPFPNSNSTAEFLARKTYLKSSVEN
jgi:Sulfotransferase domain